MAKTKTTLAKKTASRSKESGSGKGNSQLQEFFVDSLKDIYWAEKHLTKALPKMQKAATTPQLQEAIETHLGQTMEHVSRLEQVFELVGEKAAAKKCDAMEGIIKEGEGIIEETEEGTSTRDVGLILAAQKVEHYEISAYGSLITLAKTMGQDEIADILSQTLEEEKEADQLLTQIAESSINWQAEEEDEEEGEGSEEEEEEEK